MNTLTIEKVTNLCNETFTRFNTCKNAGAMEEGRKIRKDGHYPYIPMYSGRLVQMIQLHKALGLKFTGKSFMDVGCGVPVIPTIFSRLGCKAFGLEYNKAYLKAYPELIEGDLLKYDFSAHDILYSYNPLSDPNLMVKGLDNIIATMKKGAIFYFFPAGPSEEKLKSLGFVQANGIKYFIK